MMNHQAMPDDPIKSSKRVLEPYDRVSEVLFGLIMVLTFTGSLSVAAGRTARTFARCSSARSDATWPGGSSTACLYLMGCLAEKGRDLLTLRAVRKATDPQKGPAAHRRGAAAAGRLDPATGGTRGHAPASEGTARTARARAVGDGRLAGCAWACSCWCFCPRSRWSSRSSS